MGIPGSANFFLAGSVAGYQIERSLRFNSADSAYLNRTQATGTVARWTFSTWVKRSALGSAQCLLSSTLPADPNNYRGQIVLDANNRLAFYAKWGTDVQEYVSTQVLRDVSAWYHIVVAVDLTLSSPNGVKMYVNNSQVTTFDIATYSNTFQAGAINNNYAHNIGRNTYNSSEYFNGYLTETYFLNNAQLTPSSFGETDPVTGVWKPKLYTGIYSGTNSFYLKFADNSGTTSTTLGKDSSGNGNNWTPNNFNVVITGSYASTWTGSATGSPSGVQDPLGAFLSNSPTIPDNSQAGGRRTYVNHNGGTSWLQFTPAAPISGTTLRVFTYQPQGTSGADTWLNINGGADIRPWRVAANYTGWSTNITIPGGSLTSIKGSLSYGGASGMSIFAIEIDGVILRNSNESIDSLIDTPTPYADGGNGRGNYPTWNPLDRTAATYSNGNLDVTSTSAASPYNMTSTMRFPATGKWYAEVTLTGLGAGSPGIGIGKNNSDAYAIYRITGAYLTSGMGASTSGTPNTYTTNDVIGIAYDAGAGTLEFYKNGVDQAGNITGITASTDWAIVFRADSASGDAATLNCGQRAFAYTPPSGFKALNTQNLPEPSIKKPSSYFNTLLYTGNGVTPRAITGTSFQPDLVWIKARSVGYNNNIGDAVRGANKTLYSNDTAAEATNNGAGYISAFNSDGFSVTTGPVDANQVNTNGTTYVAWCWDESATPGFDIVTYTGTGSARTIAHSLGVAPQFIIVKNRSNGTANWQTGSAYHNATSPWNYYMRLNTTAAAVAASTIWNNTAPTSSVFSVGTDGEVNANGDNYVAYLWSEVAGFSKFGSYTGNGSTDGPFVFCGFRPRWIMFKSTTLGTNWVILDTSRDSVNQQINALLADGSNAENANTLFATDSLSNGFKLRTSWNNLNQSGQTFIFAAFAESPFKYSLAR